MGDLSGKHLFVLGGGVHQLHLIKNALFRGALVTFADQSETCAAVGKGAHHLHCSMFDEDRISEYISKHRVDGIVTGGTDQVVNLLARLCEKYELPCHVSPVGAAILTSKDKMNAFFAELGVPTAEKFLGSKVEDLEGLIVPGDKWVLKPADSQGQAGISVASSVADVRKAWDMAKIASESNLVVAEKFVEGSEKTAMAWVVDSQVHILTFTDRVTYNPPPNLGIAFQHIYPAHGEDRHMEDAKAILSRISEKVKIKNGPLYAQFLIDAGGVVRIIEAGCRFGGGHELEMIRALFSVDMAELSVDLALGRQCYLKDVRLSNSRKSAVINFILAKPGRFECLSELDEIKVANQVTDWGWYKMKGYEHEGTKVGLDRVGWFLLVGKDRHMVLERARQIYEEFTIFDPYGDSLVFWPSDQFLNH